MFRVCNGVVHHEARMDIARVIGKGLRSRKEADVMSLDDYKVRYLDGWVDCRQREIWFDPSEFGEKGPDALCRSSVSQISRGILGSRITS